MLECLSLVVLSILFYYFLTRLETTRGEHLAGLHYWYRIEEMLDSGKRSSLPRKGKINTLTKSAPYVHSSKINTFSDIYHL
jgi:hypothetical protein